MSVLKSIEDQLNKTDRFIRKSGEIFKWLIVALIFTIAYDVVMRYFFSKPTIWSYEISYMLGGGMMVLGGGQILLHDKHVRIEIFYDMLSPAKRIIVDLILSIVLFFPMVAVLDVFSFEYAYRAWELGETSGKSFWRPPLFPFRAVVFAGFAILTLAGISQFVRNIIHLIRRNYDCSK